MRWVQGHCQGRLETLLSVVAKPCLSYLYNSRDDVWDYYAVEEMELAEEESDHSWRAVM